MYIGLNKNRRTEMRIMLFCEFIQVALGQKAKLSRNPSEEEWADCFSMAKKQSIAGVLFSALETLSRQGQKPPMPILYDWIGLTEQIKQLNTLLNRRCTELTALFDKNGYLNCIIKGQGNALMYPDPLLRSSGDIDIWVNGSRDEIVEFCHSRVVGCKESRHHILFPLWENVKIEVHFVPSFSRVPRFIKRTQQYFEQFQREEIDSRGIMPEEYKMFIPSKEMNLVSQMSHMARHFFHGGIGFRQVMDYYYLLVYCNLDENECLKESVKSVFYDLGLYKYASAVMWILKVVFGMDEKYLIMPVDERRGKLLMDEIMMGGNFGKYDQRFFSQFRKKSTTFFIFYRNLRLMRLFPEEAFLTPISSVWYYLKHNKSCSFCL